MTTIYTAIYRSSSAGNTTHKTVAASEDLDLVTGILQTKLEETQLLNKSCRRPEKMTLAHGWIVTWTDGKEVATKLIPI